EAGTGDDLPFTEIDAALPALRVVQRQARMRCRHRLRQQEYLFARNRLQALLDHGLEMLAVRTEFDAETGQHAVSRTTSLRAEGESGDRRRGIAGKVDGERRRRLETAATQALSNRRHPIEQHVRITA